MSISVINLAAKRGIYTMMISICLSVCSFVRLSPVHSCRPLDDWRIHAAASSDAQPPRAGHPDTGWPICFSPLKSPPRTSLNKCYHWGLRPTHGIHKCASLFAVARCCASVACAVMRCVSVCLSHSYILSKRINISSVFSPSGSHTILVFLYQTARQYFNGNGGVEWRWGRQKSWFWANIWLHCVLWSVPVASAIHLAAKFVDGRKQRRNVWQEASTLRWRQHCVVLNLKPK